HPAALSPRVKSLNYLNNIMAKIEAIEGGGAEGIMLNHMGYVAECTGDNIFIVQQRHGWPTLVTPPAHAGILEGITRNLVIELAQEADLPVEEADLTRHDLFIADEVFLTGTAAEVIPVSNIDGRSVGSGTPGPITLQLNEAFRKLMKHCPEN
ncbi:MAG: aminotransferase class IV, partial [Phycisphaeraceae bacterium]